MCIVYHSFPENAIEKPQILPGFFAGDMKRRRHRSKAEENRVRADRKPGDDSV